MSTQEIVDLLKRIVENQEKPTPFSLSGAFVNFLILAFTFVASLALNNAFTLSFQEIPLGAHSAIAGAWIYVAVIIPLCIVFIFLCGKYLQPSLFKMWKS